MNTTGGNSLLPSSSLTQSSSYKGQSAQMLDMNALQTVHDFFHHEELGISVATRNLYDSTMQGGVELNWGDLFSLKMSSESMVQLQNLLLVSSDWRKMFGFCPVKRIMPKEGSKDIAKFEIPEFGTGVFFMIYDNKKEKGELKYMPFKYGTMTRKGNPNNRDPKKIREYGTKSVNTSELKFPKNYFVFVWPRLMPSLHNGWLKTVTSKLLKMWCLIKHLESNMVVNDTNKSMNPVITKRPLITQKLSDLTEEQQFGDDDLIGVDPLEASKYKRDLSAQANMNQKTEDFSTWRSRNGSNQMVTYNSSLGRFEFSKIKHPLDPDNVFNLEEGLELQHLSDTTTTAAYLDLKRDYESQLDRAFGVDRSANGGASSKLKANAEQNRELLKTLVLEERSSMILFHATVYEFVHRDNENLRIAEILSFLEEEQKTLETQHQLDPENKDVLYRTDELKRQASVMARLAKEDFRMKLIFPKNPFTASIEEKTIKLMLEQKVLTPHEEINMLRNLGGFDGLPREHELVKEREKLRSLAIIQQKEELMISPLEQAEFAMQPKDGSKPLVSSTASKKRKALSNDEEKTPKEKKTPEEETKTKKTEPTKKKKKKDQ